MSFNSATPVDNPLQPLSPRKVLICNLLRPRSACSRRTYTKLIGLPTLLGLWIRVMRWLGFRFVTLTDAMAAPGGRFVCLTVDGAYRDTLRFLEPVLNDAGVPATVFVVTGHVGKRRVVARTSAARRVTSGADWSELAALRTRGWEIGAAAHSWTDLTSRSQRDQHWQISRSRELIQDNLGLSPVSFAYPGGACDASTVKFLREEGFLNAVTQRFGHADETSDRLQLERVTLGSFGLRVILRILRETIAVWRWEQPQVAIAPTSSALDRAIDTSSRPVRA